MITGGSEAGITPLGLAGFNASKALSTNNENPVRRPAVLGIKKEMDFYWGRAQEY